MTDFNASNEGEKPVDSKIYNVPEEVIQDTLIFLATFKIVIYETPGFSPTSDQELLTMFKLNETIEHYSKLIEKTMPNNLKDLNELIEKEERSNNDRK